MDREALSNIRRGPQKVITDLGVFGFDRETKRMNIESLHENVSLEDVMAETNFEFYAIPNPIPVTEKPESKVLSIIRNLDPDQIYINR